MSSPCTRMSCTIYIFTEYRTMRLYAPGILTLTCQVFLHFHMSVLFLLTLSLCLRLELQSTTITSSPCWLRSLSEDGGVCVRGLCEGPVCEAYMWGLCKRPMCGAYM